MVAGGHNGVVHFDSVEILDTEDGSVTLGSPMNSRRAIHGIGVVAINGEDRLAVVGGYDGKKRLDSIEIYNSKTEKWEKADTRLNDRLCNFGFLSVKLSDIISKH